MGRATFSLCLKKEIQCAADKVQSVTSFCSTEGGPKLFFGIQNREDSGQKATLSRLVEWGVVGGVCAALGNGMRKSK